MSGQRKLVATGILRIDREHETLTSMLGRAERICAIANAIDCMGCTLAWRHRCATDAGLLIESMFIYMREHFKYEEQQMDWSVPHDHVKEHRKAHDEISVRVEEVVKQCRDSGNPVASVRSLVDVLSHWLDNHSQQHDAVLATFVGGDDEPDEFLID